MNRFERLTETTQAELELLLKSDESGDVFSEPRVGATCTERFIGRPGR